MVEDELLRLLSRMDSKTLDKLELGANQTGQDLQDARVNTSAETRTPAELKKAGYTYYYGAGWVKK